MTVKVEIILNDEAVEMLKDIKDDNQRYAGVRDVLLSSANELVGQVSKSGLVHGTTITKRVGVTLQGEVVQGSTDVTTN